MAAVFPWARTSRFRGRRCGGPAIEEMFGFGEPLRVPPMTTTLTAGPAARSAVHTAWRSIA